MSEAALASAIADLAAAVRANTEETKRTLDGLAESMGRSVGQICSRLDGLSDKLNAAMDDGSETRRALRQASTEFRTELLTVHDRISDHENSPARQAHAVG